LERVILLDKPQGPTSHDMVDALRAALGTRRVGHTGTLDPMATGLLVFLTGRATRLAELFRGHEKLYRGRISFGAATDTDDAEGKVISRSKDFILESAAMESALAELASRTEQRAPAFSAVKVDGVPLYKQARKGQDVETPIRPVSIKRLDLLELNEQDVEIEVLCSAGTYVRGLARDLGEILGIPAHLSELRRLASGPFKIEDAVDLAEIQEGPAAKQGLSVDKALGHLPVALIQEDYLPRLLHGTQPEEGDLEYPDPMPALDSWVAMREEDGRLRALARVEQREEGIRLRLRKTLENA
jgi:tRNA pseudouridine55 synthase